MLNKIKLTWVNINLFHCKARARHGGELTPIFYYSQVYYRSLPYQLLDQQPILLNVWGGCQEMGALRTFAFGIE